MFCVINHVAFKLCFLGFVKAEEELAIHKKLMEERKDGEEEEDEEEEEEIPETPREKERKKKQRRSRVYDVERMKDEEQEIMVSPRERVKSKKRQRRSRIEMEDNGLDDDVSSGLKADLESFIEVLSSYHIKINNF